MEKDEEFEEIYLNEISEIKKTIRKNREIKQADKVFRSLADTQDYKPSDKCNVCGKKQKEDQMKLCKFCGKSICLECSQKKRQNPQKQDQFVRICDRCDMLYLKDMLVGESKNQQKQVKKQIQEAEDELQKMKRFFLEKQSQLTMLQREYQQEKSEKEEKIDDLQKKINRNQEKIDSFLESVNKVNGDRRQLFQNIKKLEEEQTERLDQINSALFEKSELNKKEKNLDQQKVKLADFIAKYNSEITSKNLKKNNMDSVLLRGKNDSQYRESDYNVFQDTPNTPIDQYINFNMNKRSSSGLEIQNNLKGVAKNN